MYKITIFLFQYCTQKLNESIRYIPLFLTSILSARLMTQREKKSSRLCPVSKSQSIGERFGSNFLKEGFGINGREDSIESSLCGISR